MKEFIKSLAMLDISIIAIFGLPALLPDCHYSTGFEIFRHALPLCNIVFAAGYFGLPLFDSEI